MLAAVSNKVAHLDRGELSVYPGDYTEFRRQLERAEEEGWRRYEKNQKLAKKVLRQAQDVLLEALEDFPGGMLFVSHDRSFVERLATESLVLESREA